MSIWSGTSWSARFGLAMLAGGVVLAGAGAQQASVPDAQVESNVLKALASAPELSTQNIQSSTVYGTVTLSGNVHDEALRVKAENLAARAPGVKKVVDELTLGDTPAPAQDASAQPGSDAGTPSGQVLQSDGTYAPANQAEPGPPMENPNSQPPQGNPSYADGGTPATPPPPARRPLYQNQNGYQQTQNGYPGGGNYPSGPQQGQVAGMDVTVPAGVPISIRINRGIDSQHIKPGTPFDGIVMQDVVAGGAVAIPRGAAVQGTVVDAKKAGALSGQGELALQLTGVTLGGMTYPVSTVVWQREGRDKSVSTVNRALGLGVLGAVVGAVAGGGKGAAIGGGVGAAAGVASSAGSPGGQILIAPESLLTFKTADPLTVKTVSQQEMTRLAYAAGPQTVQRNPYRRRVYYANGPYGPGYYEVPPPPPPAQ